MPQIKPLDALAPERFENAAILKRLAAASRQLAELKGVVAAIPNQSILVNTLGLQEAKDSSEVENIVTTHDELFRNIAETPGSPAVKEVARYRQALWAGFQRVRDTHLLTNNHILAIQAELECNEAGFRKIPGTELRDNAGRTVYTPPSPEQVPALMGDLERFINNDDLFEADPLIKMALIHHQFESIHPFYDGNGCSGRIVNVLYLVKQQLLDIPVLYLSRYILRNKTEYYRLLQAVRDADAWEEWVCYMLDAVENTARDSIITIQAIKTLLQQMKHDIRRQYRFYSQDLINNLFKHPYTKIDFVMHDLKITRIPATRYLNELVAGGFLVKRKVGRTNYYINLPLLEILTEERS